jgi:CSLREA domain-containing protein
LRARRWIGFGLAALGAALIALALPGAAVPQAGTFVVDTTREGNDGECSNDCTLREAVALANSAVGSFVQLPPGVYRISRPLVLQDDVVFGATLGGGNFSSGARTTVIDARGSGRVVEVSGSNNWLSGVTVTGGRADVGAGAFVPSGSALFLYSVIVTDNVATAGGGGVAAAGSLSVFQSVLTGNRAGSGGGLLMQAGGGVNVYNSTLSGNTATVVGGGVSSAAATTTLWNATVAENSAPTGAGVHVDGAGAAASLWNTIFARNAGGACGGGAIQQPSGWQNSMADDATCTFAGGGATQQDPRIGPLRNNRGPTDTHALLAASPAINAGAASLCGANDQRGAAPVGTCDLGAFEFGGDVPEPVLPPPVPGETVNVSLRSGTVKVKIAGSDEFFTLRDNQQIPVKSTVDTTKGQITLVAAGRKQKAWFYDGVFKFGQSRGGRPLTTLSLTAKLSCPRGNGAIAAAKKKRRLWGDGKGRFRTKGSFSSATVRGTKWLTEDRCNGTLTRVKKGTVTVRDFRRKRTVILRAGQRYLAKR